MPSKLDHITKADGNAASAMSLPLDSQTRIDWALIALFYAAMFRFKAEDVTNQAAKHFATIKANIQPLL